MPEMHEKNILVTGALGFIGSHVVSHLVRKYPSCNVYGLDNCGKMSCSQNLPFNMTDEKMRYKFIQGDAKSSDTIKFILERYHINFILHFAGETRALDDSSYEFTYNNVMSTHILLEAAKNCGSIELFLQASSDEVYGKLASPHSGPASGAFTVLEPANQYGSTKAAADLLCASYYKSFKSPPVVIFRFSTTYGPRQHPSMVIPKFWHRLRNNQPCIIDGDGGRSRRFLYISDVVDALDIVIHNYKPDRVYNVTSDTSITLNDLASAVVSEVKGFGCSLDSWITHGSDRSYSDERHVLNTQLIRSLGWKPEVSLKDGMTLTFSWYEKHPNHWPDIDLKDIYTDINYHVVPPSPHTMLPVHQVTTAQTEKEHLANSSAVTSDDPGDANSYIPRNILVTGGCGFIGSHVLLKLLKRWPDCRIVNIDKLDYCASRLNVKACESYSNYTFVHGDILSRDLVGLVLEEYDIDTVFHFAAETHVDHSFGNSFAFTRVNVLGTHVLLQSCRKWGKINRFIHVSTDEVYGEQAEDEADVMENNLLEPANPYAATKAAAEFLVKAFYRSYKLPIIITRGNNVYGPHQYPEKCIPKFICQLMRDQPCTIHGNGKTERNFLFCDDVSEAFNILMHRGLTGHVYNISGSQDRTVLEIATELARIFKKDPEKYIKFVPDRVLNDRRYAISGEKLKELNWTENTSWEDGLRSTVDWYRSNPCHWGDIEGSLLAHPQRRVFV